MGKEEGPKGEIELMETPPETEGSVSDWMAKGAGHLKAGKYKEAYQAYSKALELDPAHAAAYFNRSLALNKLGKTERALVDLKVAARFGHEKSQALLKQRGIAWWS
jgi:tetratricopeptide (TPR) repeat protein